MSGRTMVDTIYDFVPEKREEERIDEKSILMGIIFNIKQQNNNNNNNKSPFSLHIKS